MRVDFGLAGGGALAVRFGAPGLARPSELQQVAAHMLLATSVVARIFSIFAGTPEGHALAQRLVEGRSKSLEMLNPATTPFNEAIIDGLLLGLGRTVPGWPNCGKFITFEVLDGAGGLAGLPVINMSKTGFGLLGALSVPTAELEQAPFALLRKFGATDRMTFMAALTACTLVANRYLEGKISAMAPSFNQAAMEATNHGCLTYRALGMIASKAPTVR